MFLLFNTRGCFKIDSPKLSDNICVSNQQNIIKCKQTKMLSKITLSLVFFIIMQSNVFAETPTISSIEELLRVTKSEQISKQTQ